MKKILKSFYQIIPFKKFLFQLIKKVYTPPHHIYQHLYFKDKFKTQVDKNTYIYLQHYGFQVENDIFWKGLVGGWEKESLKIWIKFCKISDTILDIGANTGIYALVAQALKPNAKVYAFEPVERVFQKLDYNNKINHFSIKTIQKAISNQNGKAIIYDVLREHTYSVTVNKNMHNPNTQTVETEIEICTLDSFVENNQIAQIDLIKIDVETHEPEVLEGMENIFKTQRPTLFIEVLEQEVADKINHILLPLNYFFYHIDEEKGLIKVERIKPMKYYNFLICTPEIAQKIHLNPQHEN